MGSVLAQQLTHAEAQAKALTDLFKQREDYRQDRERRIESRLRSYEAQQKELEEKKHKALSDISRAWASSQSPQRGGSSLSPPGREYFSPTRGQARGYSPAGNVPTYSAPASYSQAHHFSPAATV